MIQRVLVNKSLELLCMETVLDRHEFEQRRVYIDWFEKPRGLGNERKRTLVARVQDKRVACAWCHVHRISLVTYRMKISYKVRSLQVHSRSHQAISALGWKWSRTEVLLFWWLPFFRTNELPSQKLKLGLSGRTRFAHRYSYLKCTIFSLQGNLIFRLKKYFNRGKRRKQHPS